MRFCDPAFLDVLDSWNGSYCKHCTFSAWLGGLMAAIHETWSNASQFSIHGSLWIYWIYAIWAMEISSFRESILNHQSCEIRSNFSQQKRVHCRIGFAVSQVNSQREDTLDTLRRAQNEAMTGLCWCPPGHMSYKTCWCQGIKVYNDA